MERSNLSTESLTAAYPWYGQLREKFCADLDAIREGRLLDPPTPQHICPVCRFRAVDLRGLSSHVRHRHPRNRGEQ